MLPFKHTYLNFKKKNHQFIFFFFFNFRDAFQSLSVTSSSKRSYSLLRSVSSKRILAPSAGARNDRLAWPALLGANNSELARMVTGLNNTVKALNDYLMELLQERDTLLSQQDEMLENISELTDSLL